VRHLFGATAALLLSVLPVIATAQDVTDKKYYSVSISGFPIGRVQYDATTGDGLYQVQGFLGSSGFFGFFIGTRYSGAVIGEARGADLRPEVFRGRFEARGKFAQVDMNYVKGIPDAVTHQPERSALATDIPLTRAADALDPISALYLLLRDVDASGVCKLDVPIFDGVRLSRVTLGQGKAVDDIVRCEGVYARVGGFSDAQLEERTDYPFLLEYGQAADGKWRVTQFLATTDFGVARASLRDR